MGRILMPTPACKNPHLSNEEYLDIVKQLLGEVPEQSSVEVCGVWKWEVQESVAETYQKDRIICAGDRYVLGSARNQILMPRSASIAIHLSQV